MYAVDVKLKVPCFNRCHDQASSRYVVAAGEYVVVLESENECHPFNAIPTSRVHRHNYGTNLQVNGKAADEVNEMVNVATGDGDSVHHLRLSTRVER